MAKREFWSDERIKAIGRICQNLFQAMVLAGTLGGLFGKLEGFWLKLSFGLVTLALFVVGVLFADNPFKKEG